MDYLLYLIQKSLGTVDDALRTVRDWKIAELIQRIICIKQRPSVEIPKIEIRVSFDEIVRFIPEFVRRIFKRQAEPFLVRTYLHNSVAHHVVDFPLAAFLLKVACKNIQIDIVLHME